MTSWERRWGKLALLGHLTRFLLLKHLYCTLTPNTNRQIAKVIQRVNCYIQIVDYIQIYYIYINLKLLLYIFYSTWNSNAKLIRIELFNPSIICIYHFWNKLSQVKLESYKLKYVYFSCVLIFQFNLMECRNVVGYRIE